ncbi:putative proline-specific permease put4 [Purpureocillium lavendulum]|uniref:Proline-specific permease put4 n=1 Tax=Purpureocillium lavendulum TaxID=1247861 RepID=A0AB34FSH0_9HYPO|nr:putative proline-specific permease put4 [Purpureocillium lavendulum]
MSGLENISSKHSQDGGPRLEPLAKGEVDGVPGNKSTQRGLKSRHAQMIALGGTIGTGLFVGIGQGLHIGGPLFLVLAYCIITALLYGVATATGEISAYLPVPGSSVPYFANRYVSPSFGFTLGWIYWYIFAVTVPGEITATALVINYWQNPVPTGAWITIIGIVIIACNCFPVRGYGEAEFWFASTKVMTILGLLIMAVVLFFGGGPAAPLYFKHWSHPGPVNEYLAEGYTGRLAAFIGTVTFSVFAFAFAPELLVTAGGEMQSPRRNIPRATIRYFYRLVTFYVLGAVCVTILVPSDHKDLLSAGHGAAASPWAIGARDAGIKVLDSVINAMIVLSAWSAGNSYLYLASRCLYSMSLSGNAPAIFSRCSKSGLPYYALAASSSVCALAYLNVFSAGSVVLNWFVNLINSGGFISWVCCCVTYIRFRKAAEAQGITDIPFRSRMQPYAAWISGIGFFILLVLNGFKVFVKGYWDTSTFLTSYIGVVLFAALYFGHKLTVGRRDKLLYRPEEIDLHTGLTEVLEANSAPVPREKWYQKWRVLIE